MNMIAFFRRIKYLCRNFIGVHFRLNKGLLIWLGIFAVVGVIIGIATVFTPRITAKTISERLLDTNILRVVRPTTGMGSMIMGRLFGTVIFFAFIFATCMHRWTVFFAFGLIGYQGFTLVVNVYWAISKFGVVSGMVLFILYLILLIILLMIIICVTAFLIRVTAEIRKCGLRGGMKWRLFFKQCIIIATVIIAFAFFEWFLYRLILSKFVFVV